MNVRIIVAALAMLSMHCSAVPAQDHLEPEEGILNKDAEEWNYAEKLHSVLDARMPVLSFRTMVCLPANDPEWVVTLVRDDEVLDDQLAYFVELAIVERNLETEKNFLAVKVRKSRAGLDRKTAKAVQEVWPDVAYRPIPGQGQGGSRW